MYGNSKLMIVSTLSFQYHRELEEMSHHIFYEEGAAVGTHCQFAMGSAKIGQDCNEDCFCYDTTLIMYSPLVECYVQGVYMITSIAQGQLNNYTSKITRINDNAEKIAVNREIFIVEIF